MLFPLQLFDSSEGIWLANGCVPNAFFSTENQRGPALAEEASSWNLQPKTMNSFDLLERHQVNVVVLMKILFRKLTMKFLCSENRNPRISQIRPRRKTFRQTNTNRESTDSYIAPASATNMSSAHFAPQHFKHRLRGCCGTTRAGQRHLNVEAAKDNEATSSPKPNRMIKIMVARDTLRKRALLFFSRPAQRTIFCMQLRASREQTRQPERKHLSSMVA